LWTSVGAADAIVAISNATVQKMAIESIIQKAGYGRDECLSIHWVLLLKGAMPLLLYLSMVSRRTIESFEALTLIFYRGICGFHHARKARNEANMLGIGQASLGALRKHNIKLHFSPLATGYSIAAHDIR
jgi:hypothetical protein